MQLPVEWWPADELAQQEAEKIAKRKAQAEATAARNKVVREQGPEDILIKTYFASLHRDRDRTVQNRRSLMERPPSMHTTLALSRKNNASRAVFAVYRRALVQEATLVRGKGRRRERAPQAARAAIVTHGVGCH
jgi:hypothetical protein